MADVEVIEDHPAEFHKALFPALARGAWTAREGIIADPFAGVGGIHRLREIPAFAKATTIGCELEPEWAAAHPDTVCMSMLDWDPGVVDAVVTSPCYGNRMADQYLGEKTGPKSKRYGYALSLGRRVSDGSAAAMRWGPQYQTFHARAWAHMCSKLATRGRFVLNIKDHQRDGRRQHVAAWHVTTLMGLGCELLWVEDVDTGSLRHGANHEHRYVEQVWVFEMRTPNLPGLQPSNGTPAILTSGGLDLLSGVR